MVHAALGLLVVILPIHLKKQYNFFGCCYFVKMGKRITWLILPLHESETDRHLIGLSG
jgi:hypothetical protein